MISSEAASLTLSLAKGAFKLAGRMDRLMAEKDAVTSDLILPMPSLTGGISGSEMVRELKKFLSDTQDKSSDPIPPARRQEMHRVLNPGQGFPDPIKVEKWFKEFFPNRVINTMVDPDQEFYKVLKRRLPTVDWDDPDNRSAAFGIKAGKSTLEISYTWRSALVVVDVLAEFGAENTSLFFDDQRAGTVLTSVLTRFAEPDLESFTQWSPLLRHVMGATLNGLLDSKDAWEGENVWVDGVLNALVSARKKAGDDYLLGLVRGKGYRLLISEGLCEASQMLGSKNADEFERIVSDILAEAAPLVENNEGNFRDFFQEHWADLVRAGLASVQFHGPAMLEGEDPLLREALLVMVGELAKTPGKEFFTHDTVFHLANSVLGAVSRNPDLVAGETAAPEIKAIVSQLAGAVSDQGIRKTFTRAGLEQLINDALITVSDHPELVVKDSGLLQKLVGQTLKNIQGIESLSAEMIASAAIEGSLSVLADNPSLVDTKMPMLTAQFAGKLARLVAEKKLTDIQASDILSAAVDSITMNPAMYLEFENAVNEMILDAVLEVAAGQEDHLLEGVVVVQIAQQLMMVAATHGKLLLDNGSPEDFRSKLVIVLSESMTRARAEMGRRLGVPALPTVLSLVVKNVALGEITAIDAQDPDFQRFFTQLADMAVAA